MSMYCDAKICEICPELTTSQVDRCCKDGSVVLLICDTERMRIVTLQSIPQSFFSDCLELHPKQFSQLPLQSVQCPTPGLYTSSHDPCFHSRVPRPCHRLQCI